MSSRTSAMRCDEVRPLLPGAVDGAPSPEVSAHLASCRDCGADLAQYREIGERLAVLEMIDVEAPAAFLDATLALVPRGAALGRIRAVANARAARYALASLGGVAIGAGAIGLVWRRRARREDAPTGMVARSA